MRPKARNPHSGRNPKKKARAPEQRPAGGRESKASRETFPQRTKKPGAVGLANEARPGLGSRGKPARRKKLTRVRDALRRGSAREDRDPLGRNKPVNRPAPREQPANSVAHELERNTAVSGHMAGD